MQKWAHDMSRLLSIRGHNVHLVGVTHAPEGRQDLADLPYRTTVLHETQPAGAWRPEGLTGRLNVAGRVREARRQKSLAEASTRLSALFRAARPGGVVIVAQIWAMEWVARADTAGLRVIGMSHESYEASRASSRYRRVQRYYPAVDRMLTLTDEDADAWAADGLSNADAMPNPLMITPTRLPSLAEQTVVTLGRLSHEKGMDMLVEAWALVAPSAPGWRLKIYGSGPEEAALRAQAETLGVTGTLEFAGRTADVEGALTAASVYVLPSRNEGFPISVMEAMAYGLPTVAFDCAPGVRQLLDDEETGLVVPAGNVPALAAALERTIKDAGLRQRLGVQARESVQRYTPEAIVTRWEDLFALLYR